MAESTMSVTIGKRLKNNFGNQVGVLDINEKLQLSLDEAKAFNPFINAKIKEYMREILNRSDLTTVGIVPLRKRLQKDQIGTINQERLGFEKNVFFRLNQSDNLKELLNQYYGKSIKQSSYTAFITEISSSLGIDLSDVENILRNNKLYFPLESNNTQDVNITKILDALSLSASRHLEINIIFIHIGLYGGTPIYINNTDIEKDHKVGFMVYVNYQNNTEGIIHFDKVLRVNINSPTDQGVDISGNLLHYVNKVLINKPNRESKLKGIESVKYNPYDRDQKLRVIKMNNKSGIEKEFLLGVGPTHNLYLNDLDNPLVGRLSFVDTNKLIVDVVWCLDYQF